MGHPHGLDRPYHSCRDATIGLPPARTERVDEVPEVTRVEEHPTVCVPSLQVALGLDDVLADVHVQPPGTGDRSGRFLRPDQGTGVDRRQGMGSEELAECLRCLPALRREGEPVEMPVPDVVRVFDLGMSDKVDEGGGHGFTG